jgi:hypothetical protein
MMGPSAGKGPENFQHAAGKGYPSLGVSARRLVNPPASPPNASRLVAVALWATRATARALCGQSRLVTHVHSLAVAGWA